MATYSDLPVSRRTEIVTRFKQILDDHLNDMMAGRVDKMYELKEIAEMICLHPEVIKQETGHHACYFYEQRILQEAKNLLADQGLTIKAIAYRLDYDVSNFTKFFKRFMHITPSAYRDRSYKRIRSVATVPARIVYEFN